MSPGYILFACLVAIVVTWRHVQEGDTDPLNFASTTDTTDRHDKATEDRIFEERLKSRKAGGR